MIYRKRRELSITALPFWLLLLPFRPVARKWLITGCQLPASNASSLGEASLLASRTSSFQRTAAAATSNETRLSNSQPQSPQLTSRTVVATALESKSYKLAFAILEQKWAQVALQQCLITVLIGKLDRFIINKLSLAHASLPITPHWRFWNPLRLTALLDNSIRDIMFLPTYEWNRLLSKLALGKDASADENPPKLALAAIKK